MSYKKEEFDAARSLFEKPIERWITPFKCGYCGESGMKGHRYKGNTEFRHPDCFLLYSAEITKETPIDLLMEIEEAGTPKVAFDKRTFGKIVSSAVEKSPSQYNYFLVGYLSNDSVLVKDFKPVPFFSYPREPGTFGEWEYKEAVAEEIGELNKLNIVGYLHAHNAKQISHSDLFYEYFYSRLMDGDGENSFKVHAQLNNFYPVLKELTILNHKKYNGESPLTESQGWSDVPTTQFERYLQSSEGEYLELLKAAKKQASEKIISKPENYMCTYTTIPEVFVGDEDVNLFRDLGYWMDKDKLDVDVFANLELVKRIKGKIKRLPLEVK